MNKRSPYPILPVLTGVVTLVGLYAALIYAPTEKTMGNVQRIFYYHVPAAWLAFFGFFLVFLFSLMYLMRGGKKWDNRASAAAEIGLLFCSINLITGPIWAKPVWGVWWTWDARLTLTLVLWLIYVGYIMLRHYLADAERRATFSAVLGIVGFIDVPLVYFSIRWWRTQHPQPVMAGGEDSGLDPVMWYTILVTLTGLSLLFAYLFRKRLALQALRDELDRMQALVEERGSRA
jgi:heme exporter protein C